MTTSSHDHLDVIRALCQTLLLRDPITGEHFDPITDEKFAKYCRRMEGRSLEDIISSMLRSKEFLVNRHKFLKAYIDIPTPTSDLGYRCPDDLSRSSTVLRRVAVVGQCLLSNWPDILKFIAPECMCDFYLFNRVQPMPDLSASEVAEYDFQLVGIPMRSVIPEASYFRLPLDQSSYQQLFDEFADRLRQFLAAAMQWNREHGLLTFVSNFLVPQQNPMGRLLPRYDLRNFVYFIEQLNRVLTEEIEQYSNAYLFDFDQLVTTHGRRHFQDDAVWILAHNSDLNDHDFLLDQQRLEAPIRATDLYASKHEFYVRASWAELISMYRTLRQVDMVKLVVIDLDDTLWRGIAVEKTHEDHEATAGWPLGFAEALLHLRRRGILLAIVSKNEETLVTPVWQRLYGGLLEPEDFVVRKINWRPKAENLREILQVTNLLPRSVVFIDGNPVERAAVAAEFPDIRTFGSNPLVWRRLLLWSAETQVATITAESATRSEMVRAQVERETSRQSHSRDEFLASLNVRLALRAVESVEHSDFPRMLELINKSNQFNTTGARWSRQQCVAAMAEGTRFFTFEVTDKFTRYGIVGVVICHDADILQFVMSCRVVGMEVEIAATASVVAAISGTSGGGVTAALVETDVNLLARDLWKRCGFRLEGSSWHRSCLPMLSVPSHILASTELPGQLTMMNAAE